MFTWVISAAVALLVSGLGTYPAVVMQPAPAAVVVVTAAPAEVPPGKPVLTVPPRPKGPPNFHATD